MKKLLAPLVVALLLGSPSGFADAHQPPNFPIPPQQNAPWKLPDKVPDPKGELKAAVDTMFKLGLADPRGCPYHHVTVREAGKIHDARGWVLPATPGDPARYAIGWNGLIYPVEKIGKEADLAADVKILISGGRFQPEPFSNYREETSDQLLSEYAATPRMMREWAASYLLLRLGEPVQVYDDVTGIPADDFDPFADPPAAPSSPPTHLEYPSSLFLDSDHERLVQCARLIRGDGLAAFIDKNDCLAAARSQAFDRVWVEVERRVPKEERAQRYNFPFKSNWRSLLADAQRRLKPAKASDDSEIARLIATWDEVENWDEKSPPASFEKVVAAGPAAIAPLLECLEHDQRWTRAVRMEADSDKRVYYHFPHVRDLAFHALNRILRFRVVWVPADSESCDDSWYEEGVAKMKAFSNEYGNACGGELWFRILADENADIEDQLRAAKYIVRPVYFGEYGLEDCDYDLFYDPNARDRFYDPIRSIEGGQLLLRRNPSVADLLKRAWKRSHVLIDEEVAKGVPEETFPVGHGGDVRSLALRYQPHQFVVLLEQWQKGNLEVLKDHNDRLATALANLRKNTKSSGYVISMLCEETLILRFWAEDKSALHDYEQLIRAAPAPHDVPINVMRVVPDEPGMDQLAQEAVLGETAPLSLVNKPWEGSDSRKDLIEGNIFDDNPSPLLVLPSFRRALVEALQTKTKQGTLVVTMNGCSVKFDADSSKPGSSTPEEATLPGTGQGVRLCDVIVDLITPDRGPAVWVSPRFRLADPLPERDRAIAEWIKVLSDAAQ